MWGWLNRALLGAAGVAVILAAATGSNAAAPSGLAAPEPRLAGAFALDIPVQLPASTSGPEDLLRNPLQEISATINLGAGFSFESGLNVDVGRALENYAPSASAFDGLFYSPAALGSPYLSLSSGGAWLAFSYESAQGLSFKIGHATSAPGINPYLLTARSAYSAMGGMLPYDARSTDSVLAGMTWDFSRWGGVSLTASQTTERGGAFGFSNIGTARTSALGVTARVGFGGGWQATTNYSEGLTQLNLRPSAFGPDTKLWSQSYGVAVAKRSVFSKNDALGVAFARPGGNYQPFTTDTSNELQFYGRDRLLGPAQETDFELGYKTEFFGDAVALQANAAYQMNFGGQTGKDAVSLLSRAKIKF